MSILHSNALLCLSQFRKIFVLADLFRRKQIQYFRKEQSEFWSFETLHDEKTYLGFLITRGDV